MLGQRLQKDSKSLAWLFDKADLLTHLAPKRALQNITLGANSPTSDSDRAKKSFFLGIESRSVSFTQQISYSRLIAAETPLAKRS
jgi:hypothetical protein